MNDSSSTVTVPNDRAEGSEEVTMELPCQQRWKRVPGATQRLLKCHTLSVVGVPCATTA